MPRSRKVTFNIELTEEEGDNVLSRRGIERTENDIAKEIHNTLLLKFREKGRADEKPREVTPTSTKEKALV